ncbi:MAG: leucine-rich repeat protein, partial [Ruminococcus sp.]
NVSSIGESAFWGCTSLASVKVSVSVSSVGKSVFYGCTSLIKIEVDENNQTYSSLNGDLYNKSQTMLIQYAVGKKDKSFIIPSNVTSVGEYAFSGCTSLTGVTIPNSVTDIGKRTFYDCKSLTGVTIPNSITNIGADAFRGCTSLTEITIPNSVTSIRNYTFMDCTSLNSVTLGNSVTSIGSSAFNGCTSLANVTIPDSVTSVGNWAFFHCSSLISITIPNRVTDIGESAFENCTSLTSVIIGDSVISIGESAFENCTSLTSVIIGDSVISIGQDAFSYCLGLSSVTIGDSVAYIGKCAFDACISLTSVTIPNSVTDIENYAFLGCTNLTSVIIPASVANIGNYAFGYYYAFNDFADDYCYYRIDDFTIYGYNGASAEKYARDNEFSFVSLDDIEKINQDIIGFEQKYEVKYGDKPFNLNAKAETSLSYSSDNISVAEVSSNGTVTINSVGSATITITAKETPLYYSATETVEIAVSKASQEITGFEPKYDVTLSDKPFNLNAKAETALSYASDNTSVAEVSADGTVTIKGAGSATITITAEETENYNSATETVEIAVSKASQELTGFESKYDVSFGDKPLNLNAKAETALSYASDNTGVAEVSADGTVTIKGAGSATITITAEETANYYTATATVEITVNKAVQELTGFESKYDVSFGDKPFNLNAKAETALSYASDNTSVAEVSADGIVTIKGAGKATITITAEETANYKSATATAEITVNKVGQEVSVDKQDYKLTYGSKPFNLNAKAETALSYVSDNTSVAEVSADGTVTIKGAGTATITVTAEETENYTSATATVKITVGKATQKVTGVKTQYVTSAGKTFNLNPKAKTKLTYTSSNKNVAVVSSTGKVTVKGGGYAYITVKASENGNYKSAYVKTKIVSAPRNFTSKDVSKVKKTGTTKAKITWKSLAGASGYTVQLATNKSYKGAKTVKNSKNTATLTGLKKGKTCYVRLSAYTKVSGKNYSNKWYTVKFKM